MNFILNNFKTIFISLIVFSLTISLVVTQNRVEKLRDKVEKQQNNINAYEKDILSIQDSLNYERGVYKLSIKDLKESNVKAFRELEETRKKLSIKEKELKEAIYTEVSLKKDTIFIIKDLVNSECEFDLEIEYNKETLFKVKNTKIDSVWYLNHSADISSSFNVLIHQERTWKEPFFFKRLFLFRWKKDKEDKSTLYLSNDEIKINDFKVIVIDE